MEELIKTLSERHGKELQEKLLNTSVAICGLGGLGSAIAIMLARCGIGKLHLIDFDKVDISNIHRQQYKLNQVGMLKTEALRQNIFEIAPFVDVETHNVKMSEENIDTLVKDSQIVCEAFDNAEYKALLVNDVLEKYPEKYIVSGSGMVGFSDANEIKTRKITEHFYVCGDEKSNIEDGVGLVASRVMVCAAHQAHAIINIIRKGI